MKRLWLAGALLSLVIVLCLGSQWHLRRQVTSLLAQAEQLDTIYREGDKAAVVRATADLCDKLERRLWLFPCFMRHDDLTGIRETAAVLPAALDADNPDEFLLRTALFRAQLEWLMKAEKPGVQNIF